MKKKVLTVLVVIVVIAGLLLTAHLLVNTFNIMAVMKSMHGG